MRMSLAPELLHVTSRLIRQWGTSEWTVSVPVHAEQAVVALPEWMTMFEFGRVTLCPSGGSGRWTVTWTERWDSVGHVPVVIGGAMWNSRAVWSQVEGAEQYPVSLSLSSSRSYVRPVVAGLLKDQPQRTFAGRQQAAASPGQSVVKQPTGLLSVPPEQAPKRNASAPDTLQ